MYNNQTTSFISLNTKVMIPLINAKDGFYPPVHRVLWLLVRVRHVYKSTNQLTFVTKMQWTGEKVPHSKLGWQFFVYFFTQVAILNLIM